VSANPSAPAPAHPSLPLRIPACPEVPACPEMLHEGAETFQCGLAEGHVREGRPWCMAQGEGFVRCWTWVDGRRVVLGGGVR
jgi:hypothetical protein